jgi:L-fucose mutarotase
MIPDLLDAILPLFALDTCVNGPLIMMCAISGDRLDPAVEASYRQAIDKHWPDTPPTNASIASIFMTGPNRLLLSS